MFVWVGLYVHHYLDRTDREREEAGVEIGVLELLS